MPPSITTDLTGRRFGRLTVLKRLPDRTRNRGGVWLCRCDCGQETAVAQTALVSGNTQSCGGHGWWKWYKAQGRAPRRPERYRPW